MSGTSSSLHKDAYNYDGTTGWKSYRALRPGRGMYHDVRRRLPYYWSDIVDGISYRTFAGTIRIYFVKSVYLFLARFAAELSLTRPKSSACARFHLRHESSYRRLLLR